MDERRPFSPRREMRVGTIRVDVTVTNLIDPAHVVVFEGLVDTGAGGLVLPSGWKERLGPLSTAADVDLETADQRIVTAEVCGPVWIRIGGLRPIPDEVVFVDMQPGRRGTYGPLVGYTVLERLGLVIDMVTHRLVVRKYFDAKRVASAA